MHKHTRALVHMCRPEGNSIAISSLSTLCPRVDWTQFIGLWGRYLCPILLARRLFLKLIILLSFWGFWGAEAKDGGPSSPSLVPSTGQSSRDSKARGLLCRTQVERDLSPFPRTPRIHNSHPWWAGEASDFKCDRSHQSLDWVEPVEQYGTSGLNLASDDRLQGLDEWLLCFAYFLKEKLDFLHPHIHKSSFIFCLFGLSFPC